MLDQTAILLAGGNFESDRAEEILRRQVERREVGLDVARQLPHAVVKPGDRDAAVLVVERRDDVGTDMDRVSRAAAEKPGVQVAIGGA